MKSKNVKAKIQWIDSMMGGRNKIPPEGTRYCPIIKLDNCESIGDWSADFICTRVNESNQSIVELGFLSNEAPSHLLRKEKKFELFEGNKKVAIGIIL